MISKRVIGASLFALLLLGSIGLASNVTMSNETASIDNETTVMGNVTVDITLNVSLAEQAYGLLLIIEKLSNYVTVMINATLNVDNEILQEFNETEALREAAWGAYNSSNYQLAIELAMEAMEGYRDIIKELMPEEETTKNETEEYEELIIEAQQELRRAQEYLSYVEEILNEASQLGIDVSLFLELYNQTAEAYEKVEIDITNGNLTALNEDLKLAEDLREKLSEAIEEDLIPQMLSMKADEISIVFVSKLNVQLNRTIELMNMIENLTQISNVTYPPGYEEEIRDILKDYQEELREIVEEVNNLIEEGEYDEALELIKEINEELRDIVNEIKEVREEFYEEYLKEYCEEYREQGEKEHYEKYCERGEWESEKENHKEYEENDEYKKEYEWEEEKDKNHGGNYTEKWEEDHEEEKEEHEENYTENWRENWEEYNFPKNDESNEPEKEEEDN
ncbi:hypothetical protein OCC_05646 [Thermococcus litoralis DSM 5473]|uniref:Uncharacterized protein n=1 Tax=Thermococcus litoralis (strain ATCC 51850 / DSM 5473 / JCM 8560 / NS-C) TaxID=523849 RepID=H3ZMS9_THELN|nr:hypothetical protein [Thermococcus litoralis]EHR78726.1 hypothetical protein OCC_05646 [Thermococcus litoralis DSM 5473]